MAQVVEHALPERDPRKTTAARTAIAHHGEIIQGVFEDDDGRLHRGLVTLPLDVLRSVATFSKHDADGFSVVPPDRTKALRAAQLALDYVGCTGAGGRLTVASNIPIGHGYGSSTADVIASIRAATAAVGKRIPPSIISKLAVAAETATDATAFEDEALLFAHREGTVIEHFGGSLPPFWLIGFRPDDSQTVDTLELVPARYGLEEIQTFRTLRAMVARAVQDVDLALLGRAARISATINQRFLPKSGFEFVERYCDRIEALGFQVAHSGTLCGLLLDTKRHTVTTLDNVVRELSDEGFIDVRVFAISGAGGDYALRR